MRWQEFSAHRNDVQYRLAELSEAVRRKQVRVETVRHEMS